MPLAVSAANGKDRYAAVLFWLSLEKDLLLVARDDVLGRMLEGAGLTHTRHRVAKRPPKKLKCFIKRISQQ